jgi:hypothetical protein
MEFYVVLVFNGLLDEHQYKRETQSCNKAGNVRINVTLRGVRVTIVAVEKQ